MKDCISPKFLKDVRMDVPDAKSDVLRCGPRGDLVVGSDQLQVDSITTKGTVVHWFQLKAADDELAAELCMFTLEAQLRPLSAEFKAKLTAIANKRKICADGT
eukprot:scaffold221165_cov20-Tisochrysis_lutea.AAC.1